MISVMHRTASGRLDSGWEYAARDGVVHVCLRLGNATTSFAVHVCSKERPRLGAHPIVRMDGESWSILPERYVLAFPHRAAVLTGISCGIGDVLDFGTQLALTNSPSHVDEEISAL